MTILFVFIIVLAALFLGAICWMSTLSDRKDED